MLCVGGNSVGRRHVRTLTKAMGIEALYRKLKSARHNTAHPIFPSL